MSLEVFEKLESKVQQAIDTITLLQMEIEELKEKNNSLSQKFRMLSTAVKNWSAKTTSCANSRTAGRIACRHCWDVWKKFNSGGVN